MSNNGYAHPEVLVETEWVARHLDDANLRLVEMDAEPAVYSLGHVPNAVGWNWQVDTQHRLRRNIPDAETFESLLSRSGITNDTTVVVYGDRNNWFATYAFWLLKYYGHADVRLLNGGRKKWIAEGRPLTTALPQLSPTPYKVKEPNIRLRALRDFVLTSVENAAVTFVDVRSPKEYSGELIAPEHLPQEGAQRGGHIPGAVNIPWGQTVQRDGTFKPVETLRTMYKSKNVTPDKDVITYCRIGERSSHTWFVLKYLLGYPQVRNYDGAWAEWGSLIDAPIERS